MVRLIGLGIAVILSVSVIARGQTPIPLVPSDDLSALAKKVVQEASVKFKDQKLLPEEVSVTLIDMRVPEKLFTGNFQGEKGTYPASVVKLFYLGAVHHAMEEGKLPDSAELRRTMRDMIVDSTNDATNWILEAVTDAGNGPLLPDDQMKLWEYRRNSINRYYQSLGYTGINTCQKTYNDGPYGRDKFFLYGGKNRNLLTTNATSRLLATMALGKMVSADRSKQMMNLLQRNMSGKADGTDDQAHSFSAMALPKDAKLWSKAGWTGTNRHDAAYIELPDGLKFVSVVFTTGHGYQKQILPDIVSRIVAGMEAK